MQEEVYLYIYNFSHSYRLQVPFWSLCMIFSTIKVIKDNYVPNLVWNIIINYKELNEVKVYIFYFNGTWSNCIDHAKKNKISKRACSSVKFLLQCLKQKYYKY